MTDKTCAFCDAAALMPDDIEYIQTQTLIITLVEMIKTVDCESFVKKVDVCLGAFPHGVDAEQFKEARRQLKINKSYAHALKRFQSEVDTIRKQVK